MEARQKHSRSFIPAFGFDWMTPLYEPLTRMLQPIRKQLVDRAGIRPGMAVLDLGCGPGQLSLLVQQGCPGARVTGVDVDPKVHQIAHRRIAAAGADIDLRLGTIEELGFAPGSFDRVLTAFVLHHLTTQEKRSTLRAVRQVLRPGGELHIVDLGAPRTVLARLGAYVYRWSHGAERVAANLQGRIPALLREAGFAIVEEIACKPTLLGLTFWRAGD